MHKGYLHSRKNDLGMGSSLTWWISSVFNQIRSQGTTFCILIALTCIGSVTASDSWLPVEERPWIHIEIPPGWNSISEINETTQPDNARVTAYSPDKKSRLLYILDHNQDEMSIDGIRKYQISYMSQLGFRICMTKDPVIEENTDYTFFKQVYVRGVEDAAVIGTIAYPGWGQAHFVLVMEGPEDVAEYYESIIPLMQDHIRPVLVLEKKE